jgi:hypothetical protein
MLILHHGLLEDLIFFVLSINSKCYDLQIITDKHRGDDGCTPVFFMDEEIMDKTCFISTLLENNTCSRHVYRGLLRLV